MKYYCEQAVELDLKIGFGLWSSWVIFPPELIGNKYVTSENKQLILDWIDSSITHDKCIMNGNNLRYALEATMREYSDVCDVYIIGDGDIRPFHAHGGRDVGNSVLKKPKSPQCMAEITDNWKSFCQRYFDSFVCRSYCIHAVQCATIR